MKHHAKKCAFVVLFALNEGDVNTDLPNIF